MSIDAMKQALERLTMWLEDFPDTAVIEDHWAVDALRQAIAEAEKESTLQEISDIGQEIDMSTKPENVDTSAERVQETDKPIHELDAIDRAYFAGKQAGIAESDAVKREWVSLSDDDTEALIEDLAEWSRYVEVDTAPRSLTDHVRQVLAKLRKRNT